MPPDDAANEIDAIGRADRIAPLGLIGGEVGQRGLAGGDAAGGVVDLVDDRLADVAGVEGRCAVVGNRGEGRGQRWILQHRSCGLAAAVGVEEVGLAVGIAREIDLVEIDRCGHAWADVEAVGGDVDARLKQVFPRQAAMVLICELEHAQHARRADRTTAQTRVRFRQRLVGNVVDVAQVVRRRRRRRGLASVVGLNLFRRSVEVQHEGAAPDAGRLRLDEVERHLCCDRRIDRAAAFGEDVACHARRDRIGRHRHHGARRDGVLAREAGRDFRTAGGQARAAAGDRGARALQQGERRRGRWRSAVIVAPREKQGCEQSRGKQHAATPARNDR